MKLSNRKVSLKTTLALLLISTVFFSTTIYYVYTVPSAEYVVSPFGMLKGDSYIMYKDGTTYYAIDGTTGVELTSGTDADTVINSCLGTMTDGDSIFFRSGDYYLDATISITDEITFRGESSSYQDGVIFHYNGGAGTYAISVGDGVSNLMSIDMGGFTITENGGSGNGLLCNRTLNSYFRDINIMNFDGQTGLRLDGHAMEECTYESFWIYNCKYGVVVKGNDINYNNFLGVNVDCNSIADSIGIEEGDGTNWSNGQSYIGCTQRSATTGIRVNKGGQTRFIANSQEALTTGFKIESGCEYVSILFPIFITGVTTRFDDSGTNTIIITDPAWAGETWTLPDGILGYTSGTAEASNGDAISFGITFDGNPQTVIITVNENDARYIAQAYSITTTQFSLYLWDDTAGVLETTDKTISWFAEYKP